MLTRPQKRMMLLQRPILSRAAAEQLLFKAAQDAAKQKADMKRRAKAEASETTSEA